MTEATHLKLPPHSIDAEQAVIGAVLTKNSVIHELDSVLTADDFYRRTHRVIYQHMWMLALSSQPIDLVTLAEVLDKAGELDDVGGLDYLAGTMEDNPSTANAYHYAKIIRDKSTERKLISVANTVADMCFNGTEPVDQKIAEAQRLIFDIHGASEDEPRIVKDCLRDTVNEIDRRSRDQGEIFGLKTGFLDFDKATGGLKGGDMVVIAGRPSMGKSVWLANVAEHVVMDDVPVIMFSLEMRSTQICMRMIASVGKIPHQNVKSGNIGDFADNLTVGVTKLIDKKFYLDDNPRLTSAQIASRARKIAQRYGAKIGMIGVDYLGLLSDQSKAGPVDRVSQISRNLKLCAMELDCPVVVAVQLNRGVEQRPDKRPLMSDLRDSGSIEQDADIIAMLYRDEVYDDETPARGIAELILRKNRDGETKTVYLASRLDQMRFDNLDREYIPVRQVTRGRKGGFEY